MFECAFLVLKGKVESGLIDICQISSRSFSKIESLKKRSPKSNPECEQSVKLKKTAALESKK